MCHVVRITARPDGLVEITPDECSARQPRCREHSAPFVEVLAEMTLSDVDALGGLSHTATIKTSLTDEAAIQAACRRLGLGQAVRGTHTLFDGKVVEGLAVKPKGWTFAAVIEPSGQIHYDNYNGRWGDIANLHKFQQAYGVEKAKIAARKAGHTNVRETVKADGSIELKIQIRS